MGLGSNCYPILLEYSLIRTADTGLDRRERVTVTRRRQGDSGAPGGSEVAELGYQHEITGATPCSALLFRANNKAQHDASPCYLLEITRLAPLRPPVI